MFDWFFGSVGPFPNWLIAVETAVIAGGVVHCVRVFYGGLYWMRRRIPVDGLACDVYDWKARVESCLLLRDIGRDDVLVVRVRLRNMHADSLSAYGGLVKSFQHDVGIAEAAHPYPRLSWWTPDGYRSRAVLPSGETVVNNAFRLVDDSPVTVFVNGHRVGVIRLSRSGGDGDGR